MFVRECTFLWPILLVQRCKKGNLLNCCNYGEIFRRIYSVTATQTQAGWHFWQNQNHSVSWRRNWTCCGFEISKFATFSLEKHYFGNNTAGDGFWNQSRLKDGSPFNPRNLLVRLSAITTFPLFLIIFTKWRCVLYVCSELRTCPNIQMWFNSEPATSERCKVKYAIYTYDEPRTFPNVQVWS